MRREQPEHRLRPQPFFVDDPFQHRLRVGEQFARLRADDGVVEDRREAAGQFPVLKNGVQSISGISSASG